MSEIGRPVAVVTGGGRGIGRGIVHALSGCGFDLAVNYRGNAQAADDTCRKALDNGASQARAFQADVSNLDQGRLLVDQILSHFGRIDLWVHNAGVAPEVRRDILETTPESWDRVLDINLRGPYFLTQCVAQAMIESHRAGTTPDPQIHFITSVSSVFASSNRGEYCVSKAGLSMVAQLFAARLAPEGVRVFEIRPGVIATDMTAPVRAAYDQRFAEGLAPLNRWGTPEDVGKAVAALAKGHLSYATGNVLYIDGGLNLRRL
jgi:NAD(P)-dependent dehydrogenase (short-subunit alcohol dehydrogenase family)